LVGTVNVETGRRLANREPREQPTPADTSRKWLSPVRNAPDLHAVSWHSPADACAGETDLHNTIRRDRTLRADQVMTVQ
jgi:hypothetical protein